MSRSYKKNPVYTDGNAGGPKRAKRRANHLIRKIDFEDLPLVGNAYRKFFCSYNIHDFVSRWTWEDALDLWEKNEYFHRRFPTKESLYRYWYKCNRAK